MCLGVKNNEKGLYHVVFTRILLGGIRMRNIDMEIVRAAFKGCTWGNTTENVADWVSALQGDDESAKKRLFKKLFLESSDASLIRSIFKEDQIRAYLDDFNKPLYRSHLERRRKVWRFLYLGERVPIPELDWIVKK